MADNAASSNELIKLIKAGDGDAVGTLYEQIRTRSLAIARKYVKDPQDAEDMFQDAFLRALENIDKFDESRDFDPWFSTVLVNTCKNFLVKKKATSFSDLSDEEGEFEDTLENYDESIVPESAYDKKEMTAIIGSIIDELPQAQKEAVTLFYFKDYTVKQIAEAQEIPEDTVKSRLNYARKKVGEAVTVYEKKHGIKLHGVALIPALMLLFFKKDSYAAVAEATLSAGAASAAAAGLAGSAAAGAQTAGAIGAGAVASHTASAVGKHSIAKMAKLFIAALGVTAVTGTGIYVATNVVGKESSASESKESVLDLDEYVVVEASGYDGFGTAVVKIDWDAIEKEQGKSLRVTSEGRQKIKGDGNSDDAENRAGASQKTELLKNLVTLEAVAGKGLSNGDKIDYSWNVSDELKEYFKTKVKYKDGAATVNGLKEPETFDPFADVTVTFDGISPRGKAYFEYTGPDPDSFSFYSEDIIANRKYNFRKNGETVDSSLRNGDSFTIEIEVKDPEEYLEKYGRIPASFSKKYTVSGLDEYVRSFGDLSDEFLARAKKDAEDSVWAYFNSSVANRDYPAYRSTSALSDLKYAGYIMRVIKDDKEGEKTALNLIFSATLIDGDNRFYPQHIYYPVEFSKILSKGGEITAQKADRVGGYATINNDFLLFSSGYLNPYSCYSALGKNYINDYDISCGEGFEVYAVRRDILSLSDISSDLKQFMYAEAVKLIEKDVDSYYGSGWSVANLYEYGSCLMTAKAQGDNFVENNAYYTVLSATLHGPEGKVKDLYYVVRFRGLVRLASGECYAPVRGNLVKYGDNTYLFADINGHPELDSFIKKYITDKSDTFNCDRTDSLKR
ncbi:MAG: sigma-70 family RNA polymerase sigma factor [Lachnospiraceae bacterium]|nr:sigma-70 family RNA polymerase sigma factor [Lachnospiraceae bacterium]